MFATDGAIGLKVTIDGPAGAGKSSIAHQVADRLCFEFLDTGATYRAVTFGVLRQGIDLHDTAAIAAFANSVTLRWEDQRVFLNDEDVSTEIRTPEVTKSIRFIADIPSVRQRLSQLQREIAEGRDIVTEGRDQGTEVFPDAECKIFLTASPGERARRRQQQMADAGKQVTVEEILMAQNQRDLEDRMRDIGRLRAAKDAVVLSSDGMSPDEVLQRVLEIVENCIAKERL